MIRPPSLIVLIVLSVFVLSGAGCGASGSARSSDIAAGGSGGAGLPAARERAPAASLIDRLIANDNGVALRRWSVVDDAVTVRTVLGQIADSDWNPPLDLDRARSNGFRLARLPISRVDELSEAIQGSAMDMNVWYGQVLNWSKLASAPVGNAGRAVAIDGRVRPFRKSGEFQLMFRCWTAAMEDGPRMYLEILPRFQSTTDGRFDRILGSRRDAEAFRPLLMTLEMDPEYAYVLTTAPPGESWGDDDPAEEVSSGSVGPDAVGPPTIGEMVLFRETFPATRSMLVFIPAIPAVPLARTESSTDSVPSDSAPSDVESSIP